MKLTEEEAAQRKEFQRKLNELRTIITDGVAYFYAWRGLMVENDDDAKALNRYRGLFLPAQAALRWIALMQLAKAFDRDRRTVSLWNLLIEAKSNLALLAPYATAQELEQIEAQAKANEAVLKSLKHLRDTRLAHHDAIVPTSLPLTYGNVLQLVEDIKSMYNALRRSHDRNVTSFGRLADDAEKHTTEVVRIMREERERAVRRLNEELSKFEGGTSASTNTNPAEVESENAVGGKELVMSWNNREFEEFIQWFMAPTNTNDTGLRARLASVPSESWGSVKVRLSQALHDEGVRQLPALDKPWHITEDDVNRRSSQADLARMKQQILDDEDRGRRS